MRTWIASLFLALATTACVGPNVDFADAPQPEAARLQGGAPSDQAVLRFLNHPSTTFDVLDRVVDIDRRAATHLVVHRDGADGLCGTPDDRLFRSIDEVDGIKYVGEATLARIADHAHQHGWVVGEAADYGVYMGVEFTFGEARRALANVNRESAEDLELVYGLPLDVVDALVDLRPFATLADVAHVAEVGPEDLEALKR